MNGPNSLLWLRRATIFGVFHPSFFLLAITSQLEDEDLKKLFRIGVNYHGPCNLPDTTGLNWKEALLKCLEFKQPQSGTLPNPVPNQRPTTDGDEDDPAVTSEPVPGGATESDITPEPEVIPSEESSILDSLIPPSLPPTSSPGNVDRISISAFYPDPNHVCCAARAVPHQSRYSITSSGVVTSQDICEPSPSGRKVPVAPPPASVLVSPPRPVALTPSPTLLPPSSSAGTFEPSASRSCLGPSASSGSDVTSPTQRTYGLFVALRPSTPTAPAIFTLPQAPRPPLVAPATPQPSGSLHPPRMVIAVAPSRSPGSSASNRSICLPSALWVPLPLQRLPSLVPKVALRSSPPWLLPSASPPMSIILVGDWASIQLILQLHRPPPEPPPALPFGYSSSERGRALPEWRDTVTVTSSSTTFPSIPSVLHLHVITRT
ncbi:hypothetical protein DPX16_12496 [Anabarilius grahami]|uniref:Uncharacterized protein n=1 Tax=Anabarilius grahami TaxID=495550 RepID=A0A3N0Y0E2_ANAGA|nr:hypothetical protein DPX16_12496 [Anabarilius grahami]